MNWSPFIYDISARRFLVKRKLRHLYWRLSGLVFSSKKIDTSSDFKYMWAQYSCPVVNHPTQNHLVKSKVANMKKAASIFDGILLKPGEIFSFWQLIGKPSVGRGYLSGPTFERGKIVESAGGGLCQISGLIYNLALESGMTILERYPHSIDAYGDRRYLPLGRDATVAWFSRDLSFKNTTSSPVVFRIQALDHLAQGQVLSIESMPMKITIEQKTAELLIEGKKYFKAEIIRRLVDISSNKIVEDKTLNTYRSY